MFDDLETTGTPPTPEQLDALLAEGLFRLRVVGTALFQNDEEGGGWYADPDQAQGKLPLAYVTCCGCLLTPPSPEEAVLGYAWTCLTVVSSYATWAVRSVTRVSSSAPL